MGKGKKTFPRKAPLQKRFAIFVELPINNTSKTAMLCDRAVPSEFVQPVDRVINSRSTGCGMGGLQLVPTRRFTVLGFPENRGRSASSAAAAVTSRGENKPRRLPYEQQGEGRRECTINININNDGDDHGRSLRSLAEAEIDIEIPTMRLQELNNANAARCSSQQCHSSSHRWQWPARPVAAVEGGLGLGAHWSQKIKISNVSISNFNLKFHFTFDSSRG